MKASDNFKIQGYLQLFMAFWPKGHPDVKFYMAMNFDYTKPVTEDVLKTFLEASGKLCEDQNSDIKTQFLSVQSGIFFTKKFFIILHINFRGNIQAIERRKV